jgi:hypothetical protein
MAARIVGTDTVDGVDRVRTGADARPGQFMDHRYYDFGEPIQIQPPR